MGGERIIQRERQELTEVWSLRICGDRILPLWFEDFVEVKGLSSGRLFCFYDLQLEPQYLSLSFYYLCYRLEDEDRKDLLN